MNDSPAKQAARARAQRRKRMQQRQTVIFGSIIAVLLGVALFAGAVWAEIIPAPFTIELKEEDKEEQPVSVQPCPPAGSHPVPFEEITVNVLNSTQTGGLGARTADSIRDFGLNVEKVENATDLYLGGAKLVVGVDYVEFAYTVADLIPDSQIVIDARNESIIDVIIGSGFTKVNDEEDLKLTADEEIPAPEGCVPVEEAEESSEGETEDTDGESDSESEEESQDE